MFWQNAGGDDNDDDDDDDDDDLIQSSFPFYCIPCDEKSHVLLCR